MAVMSPQRRPSVDLNVHQRGSRKCLNALWKVDFANANLLKMTVIPLAITTFASAGEAVSGGNTTPNGVKLAGMPRTVQKVCKLAGMSRTVQKVTPACSPEEAWAVRHSEANANTAGS